MERKGHYCLLCMAACDAHRRFTHFDVSFTASSHDSLAWGGSKLGQKLEAGGLPRPYFFNGDNAFTCANNMIVPMGSSDFDFYQSSNRSVYCYPWDMPWAMCFVPGQGDTQMTIN